MTLTDLSWFVLNSRFYYFVFDPQIPIPHHFDLLLIGKEITHD